MASEIPDTFRQRLEMVREPSNMLKKDLNLPQNYK